MELDVADFAVFDWAEDITENMRWELAASVPEEGFDRLPRAAQAVLKYYRQPLVPGVIYVKDRRAGPELG
jgi:hypothetical protein